MNPIVLPLINAITRLPLLLCCGLLLATPLRAAVPTSERNALISLYTATNGGGWTNRAGWLGAPGTECTWYGVQCAVGNNAVEILRLESNNLKGTLPPDIGSFPNLKQLWLFSNSLTGEIPTQLGSLSALQILYLFDNDLTGTIPGSLGGLTNLIVLQLHANRLTGGIPDLANLDNLRFLDLFRNQLSGSLPASLGGLSKLERMDLSSNNISGSIPATLGGLASLQRLHLQSNALTGDIPPQLGQLSSLELLDLDRNRLTGSIPPELGQLSSLRRFVVDGNQLTGNIPGSFGSMPNLVHLSVASNALVGSLAPNLANLTQMATLNLAYNGLDAKDAAVRSWASSKQPGWDATQTIAPANVTINSVTTTTVHIQWSPIAFSSGTGRYEIWADSGSGNRLVGSTSTKTVASLVVRDLEPGRSYVFVVRTITEGSATNSNTVTSEYSNSTSATTQTFPSASVADQSASEGGGVVMVTVTLSKVGIDPVTLSWSTADQTATAGMDFTAAGGTLVFSPGETSKNVDVAILNDTLDESDETLIVKITNPRNVTLGRDQAIVTIGDDDDPPRPPQIIISSNPPPVFAPLASPSGSAELVLTNLGDMSTTVNVVGRGDAISLSAATVAVGAGSSSRVKIGLSASTVGVFVGTVSVEGPGVPSGLSVPVSLIVYGPPGERVPDVEPTKARVDLSGPGSILHGFAEFRNTGTAPAVGVLASDVPWLIPDSNAPLTIDAGKEIAAGFTIDRAYSPDPTAQITLATTIRFVYPSQELLAGRETAGTGQEKNSGHGVTGSRSLAAETKLLPAIPDTQIALTMPRARNLTVPGGRVVTDLSITSSADVSDLRLYYLETALLPANAKEASLPKLSASAPYLLADVVGQGFERPSSSGSIHFRSSGASSIRVDALTQVLSDSEKSLYFRETPVSRSDLGARSGESLYLAGISMFGSFPSSVSIQEVAGGITNVSIDMIDASGTVVAALPLQTIREFQQLEVPLPVVSGTATIVVRNVGGEGSVSKVASRITAHVEDNDNRLDGRSVWDSSSVYATRRSDPVIILGTRGGASRRPDRRRGVRLGGGPTLEPLAEVTQVALFSPNGATVQMAYRDPTRTAMATVTINSGETRVWRDFLASVFGRGSDQSGVIVLTPLSGELVAAAWTTSGSSVTTLPVLPGNFGSSGKVNFNNVADYSRKSIEAKVPVAVAPALLLMEISGAAATVDVTVQLSATPNSAAGEFRTKRFDLQPNGILVVEDVVRNIVSTRGETDQFGITISVRVQAGKGKILPALVSSAVVSGDRSFRVP